MMRLRAALLLVLASCRGPEPEAPPRPPEVVIQPSLVLVEPEPEPEPMVIEETPRDMVLVPAGPFPRGCSPADVNCYDNERPARTVHLDAFFIDRHEVTVRQYRDCVEHHACSDDLLDSHTNTSDTSKGPRVGSNSSTVQDTTPSDYCNWGRVDRDRHPINCVNWHQAASYCRWRGKRLPSEAEWEKAARGTEPQIYPWGNERPTCARVVMYEGGYGCGRDGTWPVGSKMENRSAYGALDMTGNVWEWTADWYGDDYYHHAPDRNPPGPKSGVYRVVKGGGWADSIRGDIDSLRISNRYSYGPQLRFMHTGFRCARSVGSAK